MSFKYLICLDFEATCWPNNSNKQNAEIIEFAAVLLNISNGALVDCFHHFVRPTRYPILSPYCINLTGITQAHIDLHEPFLNIYNKFLNWLRKLQLEMGLRFTSNDEINASDGPNATFCSWSNWDLEFFFPIECARYHITCPIKLKAWIDVSVLFETIYSTRGGGRCWGFAHALRIANISTVGNPHSGISDAINLAKLAIYLINEGAKCNRVTNYYR